MDIQTELVLSNNSEIREKIPVFSVNFFRESLIASSEQTTPYHDRIDMNIDSNPNIKDLNTQQLELSLETEQEKTLRIGMAANHQETMRPLNVNNKTSPSHVYHEDNIINIQLPYDSQILTESELWSGSFHPISLYGSIEHLTSDSKNIKVTLNYLVKYIQNKKANGAKVNDLNNLDSIGDAIWNFILAVYVARQDALFTDQKTNTLRNKISSKFTPRISPTNGANKKEILKSTKLCLFLPYQLNSRRKSMSYPNIFNL